MINEKTIDLIELWQDTQRELRRWKRVNLVDMCNDYKIAMVFVTDASEKEIQAAYDEAMDFISIYNDDEDDPRLEALGGVENDYDIIRAVFHNWLNCYEDTSDTINLIF